MKLEKKLFQTAVFRGEFVPANPKYNSKLVKYLNTETHWKALWKEGTSSDPAIWMVCPANESIHSVTLTVPITDIMITDTEVFSWEEYQKLNTALIQTLTTPKNEGLKLDQDKIRMDLLPIEALVGTAQVLTFGANKYSHRNWELGMEYGRVYGALLRHITAWWNGEDLDPESGLNHLHHAGCCIMFLQTYVERNNKTEENKQDRAYSLALDNRPRYND